MQRNMDLVRMILTKLESSPGGWAPRDFGIQSFSAQEIAYHAHIMMQEGLIEAVDVTSTESSGPAAMPSSLTWKGHEFLDLARDQDRWNRAKAIVARVGGAPISVWTKVLTDLMLQGVDAAITKGS
ncbi:MAG TPA: DUF2513 domain-containing protein [Gemmataceae bacterium]|nr:DUF2513 domain-containing protein [Gemmataceae bacterium]